MPASRSQALRAELAKLALRGGRLVAREVRRARSGRPRSTSRSTTPSATIIARSATSSRSSEPARFRASVVAGAARIFTRLAEAEARVHGTEREDGPVPRRRRGGRDRRRHGRRDRRWTCSASRRCTSPRCPIGGASSAAPHGRMPVPGAGHRRAAARLPGRGHRGRGRAGDADRRGDPHDARRRRRPDAGDDRRARRLRGRHARTCPARPTSCAASSARPTDAAADETVAAGRDDDRRHVPPALRAPDGAAVRGRRPRRVPHARR